MIPRGAEMDLTFEATFDGEVFRPDEPVDLEPNTKVELTVKEPKKLKLIEKPKKGKGEPYAFLKYLESVEIDAPPDYASNLDKYLYGGKPLE